MPLFDLPTWPEPPPCADSLPGCYSSYVLMVDLDGDGDQDTLFANGGGYYTPAEAEPIGAWRNEGGTLVEAGPTWFGAFTGRLRQVTAGDIDGDGDLDLIAPDSWAMQPDAVFVQTAPGVFVDEGPARLASASRAGAVRLGDLDGDGDLDLFVSDWGEAPPSSPGVGQVYDNDGAGFFHLRAGALPADLSTQGTGPIDVDLFDADGDLDLDLLLASRQGESLLLRNNGAGLFTDAGADLPDQPGPYVYGPDACDIDRDGDLDLVLDNGGRGASEQVLENDGEGVFVDVTDRWLPTNPRLDDNEVECADLDGDGWVDLVIASLSGEERVLRNTGAAFEPLVDDFPAQGDSTLGIELGDVDGDGLIDAVTAQGESGRDFVNKSYRGLSTGSVDAWAWVGPAGLVGNGLVFAVRAPIVGDVGPLLPGASLAVRLPDGRSLTPRFVGGDLFRADLGAPPQQPLSVTVTLTLADGRQVMSVSEVGELHEDSGAPADTASFTPTGDPKEGCGCTSAPARPLSLAPFLLGLWLARRRTRRSS
jgi:hypothetical protein